MIPSEDEWYKAAYHYNDGVTGNYFDYPPSSDSVPIFEACSGGSNTANYYDNAYALGPPFYRNEVGCYVASASPYGTFDQGGNVWEWNEAVIGGSRGLRGGAFDWNVGTLRAARRHDGYPLYEDDSGGFRVAEVVGPVVNVQGQKIYWTDTISRNIQRANLDGTSVEELHGSEFIPRGLAIDPRSGKMYWATSGPGAIHRANLDGSEVETVFLTDAINGQGYGIAIDVSQGKIYWAALSDTIHRANYDGTDMEDIITGLGAVADIALDLAAGKIYWGDINIDRIRRANLDGSEVEDLVTENSSDSPSHIALDLAAGKMYWKRFGGMQRADLDGANEESFGGSSDSKGMAILMTVEHMYFAEGNPIGEIRRIDLDGGGRVTIVSGLSNPWGVVVFIQGDMDADEDVDVDDFDQFETCFSGEGVIPSEDCSGLDFDFDYDVDCSDWQSFKDAWTGPPAEPPLSNNCDCNDTVIVASSPQDGTIDVLQDRSITGRTPQGLDRIELTFNCPVSREFGDQLTVANFEIVDTGGTPPAVLAVTPLDERDTSFEIVFSDPIASGEWTTVIAHVFGPTGISTKETFGDRVTLGFLPGDIDMSGTTTAGDILALIDAMNLVPGQTLPGSRTDVNRSGVTTGTDILRLIDLLNGVNTTRPWIAASLPERP